MTTDETWSPAERRLTPADVHDVRFPRGTMLRPGYGEAEVDRFLARVADELARLISEKAELRDQVRALREQVDGEVAPPPPSEQAMRIIMTAQQTADSYVAEAEEFSQQMTRDARVQYEEQVRLAKENAGAIIVAAQEAAAKLRVGQETDGDVVRIGPSPEELEEQVAYLKAFGSAVRTQLRAYLEALLGDVEAEWGRADPAAVPPPPIRTPAQRSGTGPGKGARSLNVAAEVPPDDGAKGATRGEVEVSARRK